MNLQKQEFYKKIIVIGAPMALSQLMTSLLSLIDTFMVSGLGENAIAAVGAGASFMFLLTMIEFGFFSGISIFFAQYWGSKDIKNIHKLFIIAAAIGVVITSVFFIAGFFFTEQVIGIFSNSGNAQSSSSFIDYGVQYMSIVVFSYITLTITFLIGMLMRSVERVLFPQVISVITVVMNTGLNYVLISGRFGFPALGVRGAAIATLLSSSFGAICLVLYIFSSKEAVFHIQFSRYKDITLDFIKMVFKKALPVALNETVWGLGMTFYLIAYGFRSTEFIASIFITNQVMGLFWSINAGISGASAIMLGNKLGANQLDIAKDWGKRFTKLVLFAGLLFGGILFLTSDWIASLFKEEATIERDVALILKVFSFYVPIKFTNALHIIGTLRSGGDTRFALFAEIGPLWLIGVPLAFILTIYTDLPLYIIVAFVNLEEVFKLLLLVPRFFTFKWVNNLAIEA